MIVYLILFIIQVINLFLFSYVMRSNVKLFQVVILQQEMFKIIIDNIPKLMGEEGK